MVVNGEKSPRKGTPLFLTEQGGSWIRIASLL
jgi:hypothetical protein